nr:hypothetical protein [Kibdelosporangium sp. MJ126-NF4]CTQ99192.1 hypothetical protein [Kibdelosporangium sp. MJ126-NF4]
MDRNNVEDALWALSDHPPIPKRIRREIGRRLNHGQLVHQGGKLMRLLRRVWVLDDNPYSVWLDENYGLYGEVNQHFFRHPEDWSVEDLFEHVGALDAVDKRFAVFLEGLVSADVVPDVGGQRVVADVINTALHQAGLELREVGEEGGYPVFGVISTRAPRGRPKNLIFASQEKPDIRFSDAIDNHVEIVTNADKVLVYDRPIGTDGLKWRDLQMWWQEAQSIEDAVEVKTSLYRRLKASLPVNSPPQRLLFELYHQIHSSIMPDMPALLPEVWLHWDPRTMRLRGRDALLNSRMDFLLLLPHGKRIVLEVDGSQHYSRDGRADPALYAKTMRGDRHLALSGYEVFRFGAAELRDDGEARVMVKEFFGELFRMNKPV